jgi:acylphosphatase
MPVLHATVHGRVQGVGFRWFVCREARILGLTGYVANQAGGSVELAAEGDRARLERLLELLRGGPDGSHVDRVEHLFADGTLGRPRFVIE